MEALFPLVISLAGSYGPTLMKMLLGPKAGAVTQSVVDTLHKVFGTVDPATINAAVAAKPDLVPVFVEALKSETAEFHDALVDIEDARKQTLSFAQLGSNLQWGAPVVSVVVTVGFSLLMLLWLVIPPSNDPAQLSVFSILVGTLASSFGAVVQYWLGSSAGSRDKDTILHDALTSAQANVTTTTNKTK